MHSQIVEFIVCMYRHPGGIKVQMNIGVRIIKSGLDTNSFSKYRTVKLNL